MPNRRYRRFTLSRLGPCAAALALVAGMAVAAADRDTQEVSRYVLTDAGLAKYSAAIASLGKLGKPAQGCDDKDDETPWSLDKAVAEINAQPAAKAAIQGAGMTAREYVVFSMSLFQTGVAAWALEQPGGKLPPDVSKANVDFYKAHKASMDKLGAEMKDKCKDSGDERDTDAERDSGE